jgi:hypothetical protein
VTAGPLPVNEAQGLSEILRLPWAEVERILARVKPVADADRLAPAPHETRRDLEQMRQGARSLRDDLKRCSCEARSALADFFSEGWPNAPPPRRFSGDHLLDGHITELDSLVAWLSRAIKKVPKSLSENIMRDCIVFAA